MLEQIALSKKVCDELGRRVRGRKDLQVFAALWNDRAYAGMDAAPQPSLAAAPAIDYRVGMSVWHATFGQGEVTAVEDQTGETFVTVRFGLDEERRFAAALVGDKLLPR